MTQINGQLIVSDGVHRPWIGTNLSSAPITGTPIDGDGLGTAWAAVGEPQIYVGSLVFISATTFGNVTGGIGIIWSEPNQPAVGYMQTGYADFWNLIQTGTTPLYALKATNSGLYYSRSTSWGVLSGTPSINFQNTATHDVVSINIGCVSSKSVKAFGNYLYFADQSGRAWRFAIGGSPEPIWLKMRQFYESATRASTDPQNVQQYIWAVIEPNLNLYILFSFPDGNSAPLTGYVFDAATGVYEGRWQIGLQVVGFPNPMAVGGILVDGLNRSWLVIIEAVTGNTWGLNLTETGVWNDTGITVMPVVAQTQRLGYSTATEWTLNTVRALTANVTPVSCTSLATNGSVAQGTATPPASSDGTNLAQWSPVSTTGRGFQLQFRPTTTTSQWRLFRAEVDLTAADVVAGDA